MVFFVISRKGFENYLAVTEKLAAPLWISAGVISQSELESLRRSGAGVTDFIYAIDLSENEVIDEAISFPPLGRESPFHSLAVRQ